MGTSRAKALEQKCFINICHHPEIAEPTSTPSSSGGKKGNSWSVPHMVSGCRADRDNKGEICSTFDVVFHPKAVMMAERYSQFMDFVVNSAMDSITRSHKNSGDKLSKD